MGKSIRNTSGRKVRSDMKIGKFEHSVPVSGVTKKSFLEYSTKPTAD